MSFAFIPPLQPRRSRSRLGSRTNKTPVGNQPGSSIASLSTRTRFRRSTHIFNACSSANRVAHADLQIKSLTAARLTCQQNIQSTKYTSVPAGADDFTRSKSSFLLPSVSGFCRQNEKLQNPSPKPSLICPQNSSANTFDGNRTIMS